MDIRRRLIDALDRRFGRRFLSFVTTLYLQRQAADDVRVLFDDVWIHRFGGTYFADSERFCYYEDSHHKFASRYNALSSTVTDFWFYLYKPKVGDVIIDVGAGNGTDTLAFSRRVGGSGRILAIEAQPRTFRLLQACRKWNGLKNVTLCDRAVLDTDRVVYIEDLSNHGSNSVLAEPSQHCWPQPVRGTSLDNICEHYNIRTVDYLKMNIEGAEASAIKGMEKMIRKTRYVTIACHDFRAHEHRRFQTKEAVLDFLQSNGFRITVRNDDTRGFVRDHVHGENECAVDLESSQQAHTAL